MFNHLWASRLAMTSDINFCFTGHRGSTVEFHFNVSSFLRRWLNALMILCKYVASGSSGMEQATSEENILNADIVTLLLAILNSFCSKFHNT